MIGLLFFVGAGLWIVAAIGLSAKIPRWLGLNRHAKLVSVLVFPLVLVAPIADELIGRWQFNRLCEREAVVTLSPDWERVKRARKSDIPFASLNGFFFRIRTDRAEYFDMDTDKRFLSIQSLHTSGGFLLGYLGLGLGGGTSCWPKDWIEVTNKINIDQLLKQGATK